MLVTKLKIKISNIKYGVTVLFFGSTDGNGSTKFSISAYGHCLGKQVQYRTFSFMSQFYVIVLSRKHN
jgi:hypothetical protein